MTDGWIPLATAAGLLGWSSTPTLEQAKQFGERLRDGLIGYKMVHESEGSLVFRSPPPLDFDRSTAAARVPVDTVWAFEQGKLKVANIPILVLRSDVEAQASSLRGAISVRMNANARAEDACAAWIATLPTTPVLTRAQTLAAAKLQFGANLGIRAFGRAWDRSAPMAWRRAGQRLANRNT